MTSRLNVDQYTIQMDAGEYLNAESEKDASVSLKNRFARVSWIRTRQSLDIH